ncbi:hypothetical protein ACTXT7_004720 [Hymenolepis weldensis]
MDVLEAENEDLKLQLSITDCINSYKRDERSTDELSKLIYSYNEQVAELLKSGLSEYYERLEFYDKIKERTEDKIHLSNEKLGSLFAAINKVRKEVDDMYIQREQFVKNWKKLQNDLEEVSQKKKKAVTESLKAYDEREKLLKKVRVVSVKSAQDADSFDVEVKERQRMNNYIDRLNTFMKMKLKSRHRKSALPTKGEDPVLQFETHLNQIEIYEEAFNKLYQILGVKDISQIIAKFKANEEEIHRSVEFINANNADRSQLKEEIDDLENQKLRTLTYRKENDDKFRQQILELDGEYSYANSEKLALSKSVRSTKRTVKLVLAEIKKLASVVHCILDAEENMDSLMFFSVDKVLVAIEDRIGFLHNIYDSQKYKLSDEGKIEEAIIKSPDSLSDSAISEDGLTTRSTEDLPSVGIAVKHESNYKLCTQRPMFFLILKMKNLFAPTFPETFET